MSRFKISQQVAHSEVVLQEDEEQQELQPRIVGEVSATQVAQAEEAPPDDEAPQVSQPR